MKKINPDTSPEDYNYIKNQIKQLIREYQKLLYSQNEGDINELYKELNNAGVKYFRNPTEDNLKELGEKRREYINKALPDL
nr:MAG TPA: hypothetical protein [Caudoviricetes sp.]